LAKRKLKGTTAHQRYYVEVEGEKVLVPGVTTVTGLHGGSKNVLITWANRLGLEGTDAGAYSDRAKKIGTIAHHLIECDMKGETPDLSLYAPYEVEVAESALDSYRAWRAQEGDIKVLLSEAQLTSPLLFGGTIDLYAEVTVGNATKNVIIDYKTATDIYPEHKYQVTAYAHLLLTNGYKVDEAWILGFPKEKGETYKKVVINWAEMDILWRGFCGLLDLYHCEKELRNFRKGA
jgi:hypothetical protein